MSRKNSFKNSRSIVFIAILLSASAMLPLAPQPVVAQPETNIEALEELGERLRRTDLMAKASRGNPVEDWLAQKPEIQFVYTTDRGERIYYDAHNLNAARTIGTDRVWPGGSIPGGLNGSNPCGMMGIWDSGGVLTTHQEFGGRIHQFDAAPVMSAHPSHVAGTMVGAGVLADAHGMAFQATDVLAYDWINDSSEMSFFPIFPSPGPKVSNHSYGITSGWHFFSPGDEGTPVNPYCPSCDEFVGWFWFGDPSIDPVEDYKFGFYDATSANWDQIAYNAPFYTIVTSAGNDRTDTGPPPRGCFWIRLDGDTWTCVSDSTEPSVTRPDPDGGTSGFDCLPPPSSAKNIITVGAVEDIPSGYAWPSSVQLLPFSSWGPTDDGRIKPDVVANGDSLYSPIHFGTSSYDYLSGTSMAAPGVSGSIGLLNQHYLNTFGSVPRASTLKALVIHTADEAGPAAGPDYKHGWGLMNTRAAAQLITDAASTQGIVEDVLEPGAIHQYDVIATGEEPFVVTLAWVDPAGTPPSSTVDPPALMLVHDLDVRVTSAGTTYLPYLLDPANPNQPATTGDNIRDNVEQVVVNPGGQATMTVTVKHKGTLTDRQYYSLVFSGISGYQAVLTDQTTSALAVSGSRCWGVSWGDFDGDQDPDLYVVGKFSNKLFRNDLGSSPPFVDVATTPVADPGNARAASWADYDNDGDLDIYLSNHSFDTSQILRNGGGGSFTAAGATASNWGMAVTWADCDCDGDVDVYQVSNNGANEMFRNDGGSPPTFTSVTGTPINDTGPGQSAAWGDYDNDGDQDLFITNAITPGTATRLFRNDCAGRFVDVTTATGAGLTGYCFGAAWGDYDNDGDLDLYVTRSGANVLLQNNAGVFVNAAQGALADALDSRGAAWGDYDNDGDLDLYVANSNGPNRLLRNDGSGSFVALLAPPQWHRGRGSAAAWADYNLDGCLDLYLTNDQDGNKLMQNACSSGSSGGSSSKTMGNHWIHFDLAGTSSNGSSIGARVRIVAGEVSQIREVNGGSGLWSQNSLTVEFGLGPATVVDTVEVRWPSGTEQHLQMIPADQRMVVTERRRRGRSERLAPTDPDESSGRFGKPAIPAAYKLYPSIPNPFNPVTTIQYDLPAPSRVDLQIYDVGGRLVRTLERAAQRQPGRYRVIWNGLDDAGRRAASGVYFYRIEAGGFREIRKMMLLK